MNIDTQNQILWVGTSSGSVHKIVLNKKSTYDVTVGTSSHSEEISFILSNKYDKPIWW